MIVSPAASDFVLLSVAQSVACTEAEGPGRRFALWLQGCPLRCHGCCNPEMLPFAGGSQRSVEEVLAEFTRARLEHEVEGLTLLGGEPFAQAAAASELAARVQALGGSVMIFSGFTLAQLQGDPDPAVQCLLESTDILVDGPYLREHPDASRRWIGSTNQQIHFLSERYRADDPRWQARNTLEIRLVGGELTVNGFPSATAHDFWRRLPRAKHTE